MNVTFELNKESRTFEAQAGATLLELLRANGLYGSKHSCDTGNCGACTVIVDGRAVLSCLLLAFQVEGCSVTTIEGLAADELHPVQRAFVEKGAPQCGYCMAGMMMSATTLLEKNPTPDEQEIREGLAGNLCRCTGYVKTIDAIEYTSKLIEKERT